MKYVVIGVGTGASIDAIMAVYPRHKVLVEEFKSRGVVIASEGSRTSAIWASSEPGKSRKSSSDETPSALKVS